MAGLDATLQVRLESDLLLELAKLAREGDRTTAAEARLALRDHVHYATAGRKARAAGRPAKRR